MDTCNKISNNYLFKYWISIATIKLINKGWKPRLQGMTVHGKLCIPQINPFHGTPTACLGWGTLFPELEEDERSSSPLSHQDVPRSLLWVWEKSLPTSPGTTELPATRHFSSVKHVPFLNSHKTCQNNFLMKVLRPSALKIEVYFEGFFQNQYDNEGVHTLRLPWHSSAL